MYSTKFSRATSCHSRLLRYTFYSLLIVHSYYRVACCCLLFLLSFLSKVNCSDLQPHNAKDEEFSCRRSKLLNWFCVTDFSGVAGSDSSAVRRFMKAMFRVGAIAFAFMIFGQICQLEDFLPIN